MAGRDDLLRALEPRVGLNLKYRIEKFFGNHREAASIALALFHSSADAKIGLAYLDGPMSALSFMTANRGGFSLDAGNRPAEAVLPCERNQWCFDEAPSRIRQLPT
jgi:hypothetical protein